MSRKINRDKLHFSKWTAVVPENRETHFLVTRLLRDEGENITGCVLEAVMTQREQSLDWRDLKDDKRWCTGWC